jgi:hypothetical protein
VVVRISLKIWVGDVPPTAAANVGNEVGAETPSGTGKASHHSGFSIGGSG